ncbi:MAG: trypsin-like serine protease [Verrucomicrobiota bacterium]
MKSVILFSLCLLIAACAPGNGPSIITPGQNGLGFLPGKAEKGTLFKYYQPKAGSEWRNNWAGRLDLTGVSWNDARTATLISPSHVVMAAHFIRPSNVAVMFHDRKGNPYERYITAVRSLNTGDIAVARLNLPLPPEVKWYRLANAAEAAVGTPVIVSDQTSTLSVHRIEAVYGSGIRLGYIPGLNPIYQRNLIVGDSGNPSFILRNGELVLLETHTTGGPGAGPFYGDPTVQASVRAAMKELGN